MSEILIARFKNKKEAVLIEQLIGTIRQAKILQKGNNLEDMYFAELINEGMKEKSNVDFGKFKKELNKRIAKNLTRSK